MNPLLEFKGIVLKGNQLGRTIGFPTANLKPPTGTQFPLENGVYAVKVNLHGREMNGMANVGVKPTLGLQKFTVEVNIFDFSEDIYDEELTVAFYEFLRKEQKFSGLDALKNHIFKDKEAVLKILSNLP